MGRMNKYQWTFLPALFLFLGLRSIAQNDLNQSTSLGKNDSGTTLSPPIQAQRQDLPTAIPGKQQFSITYRKNKPHGPWKSWYANTTLCDSGNFIMGVPDGEWKGWYPNGKTRFIRTYSADKLERIAQESRKHPKHIHTPLARMANTDPTYLEKATSMEGSFGSFLAREKPGNGPVKDLPSQAAEWNTTEGNKGYLPPFSTGLLHGLFINYYPTGAIKDSGYYKNGLKEGHWEEWLESGQVKSAGSYLHGVKNGSWSFYSSKGKLLSVKTYNNKGEVTHQKFFE